MLTRNVAALALVTLAFAFGTACKKKEADGDSSAKTEKSKKGGESDDEESDEGSSKKKGAKCPSAYHDFPEEKDEQTCVCKKGDTGGSVWGTDLYTGDSSPCAAAIHAGVIDESGGTITMKHAKGCPAYVGSKKNGIKSDEWGEFESSFYFPDKHEKAPKCALGPCPNVFGDIKDVGPKTEIECTCGKYPEGTVYGTGIFTQDSSICAAAKHAGLIDDEGGTVKAKAAPGCGKYEGTKKNGITTESWDEYKASFYFPEKGDGVCKVPK